jgi:GTP-binding protein Era
MKADFKSGYVVIIGKPNVGKSTLMNKLIGEKLSITSPKPQTTRLSIKGILNDEDKQVIFLDTPGYLNPRYEMQERMLKQLTNTLKDADVVLYITEVNTFPTDYDQEIFQLLKSVKRPQIAILNKLDLAKSPDLEALKAKLPDGFEDILFVSAKTGENIDKIIPLVTKFLPYGPAFYDTEQLSDLPMRFFAHEIIREAIFHQYEQEIPYATAVLIDKYEELPDKIVVDATIWIERDSQKPIIIGKKGEGLRNIREYAQKELTAFNQIYTEVHLFVKIKKNWRRNPSALKEIGLTE